MMVRTYRRGGGDFMSAGHNAVHCFWERADRTILDDAKGQAGSSEDPTFGSIFGSEREKAGANDDVARFPGAYREQ